MGFWTEIGEIVMEGMEGWDTGWDGRENGRGSGGKWRENGGEWKMGHDFDSQWQVHGEWLLLIDTLRLEMGRRTSATTLRGKLYIHVHVRKNVHSMIL
jgi:hypothetical protein